MGTGTRAVFATMNMKITQLIVLAFFTVFVASAKSPNEPEATAVIVISFWHDISAQLATYGMMIPAKRSSIAWNARFVEEAGVKIISTVLNVRAV